MIFRCPCWRIRLVVLATHVLLAADASADPGGLVTLVDRSQAKFRPVAPEDVSNAKATVQECLLELTRVIGNGQDWRDYLMWDEQFQSFDGGEVGTADLWQHVYARVARDTDLLEEVVFQRYRAALQNLIHCIKAYENANLEADYLAALTELTDLLSRSDGYLQTADAPRISELLTKLARQQQAPQLIAAIRDHAQRPNLIIKVPANVLAGDQHFEEDYAFRQVVRGSQVTGTGKLAADQSFAIGAGEDAIVVQTVVTGHSNSSSVGFGNGVTVRSAGELKFQSATDIFIGLEGVASNGFDTNGTLATRILGISTGYARRAAATARRTVYGRQEADRWAAQSQALASLDSTFEARLDGMLTPLQAAYRKNVYLPLIRHDRLPQKATFSRLLPPVR